MEARPRVLSSSLKCLQLLTTLSEQMIPMSLGTLSELTGQPKGTVHQQLRTLIEAGYVVQNSGGSYQVSLLTIGLGSAALEQERIGSRVAAGIAALAARSGETASLSVLANPDEIFLLYRVSTDSSLLTDLAPGSRMPAGSSASGRVLRAFSVSDDEPQADASVIEIRQRGFAVSADEFLIGMTTIAVPVKLPGVGLAALSLAAPTVRFEQDKLLTLLTRSRVL